MGRRAKKAKVVTKKKPKLAKLFKCPFCANEDTVECKMDFKASIGSLVCRVCGATYQMPIHHLNEPIDVFSEWLDDCEAAANPNKEQHQATGTDAAEPQYDDALGDDDDDDDLGEGSGLRTNKAVSNNKKSSASSMKSSKKGSNQESIDLGLESDEDDDE